MQEDNEEKKSFKQKLMDFDWLTLILAIIVITVFTVGIVGAIVTMIRN